MTRKGQENFYFYFFWYQEPNSQNLILICPSKYDPYVHLPFTDFQPFFLNLFRKMRENFIKVVTTL